VNVLPLIRWLCLLGALCACGVAVAVSLALSGWIPTALAAVDAGLLLGIAHGIDEVMVKDKVKR